MKVKLIGIQKINFNNANNEEIKGTLAFVVYPEENVQGLRTDKFFLKDGISLPEGVKVNDTIDISFNRKGKVEMIFKAN